MMTTLTTLTALTAQAGDGLAGKVQEPGFAQWVVYLLVFLYVIEKVGTGALRLMGRSPTMQVSAETREAELPAKQKDLEVLKKAFEDFTQEEQARHNAAVLAGQQRVTDLSTVVDTETDAIAAKIEAMQTRLSEKLDREFAGLHEKLNAAASKVAAHDEAVANLKERIADLAERYNAAMPKLHSRIDDLVLARKRGAAG